jgi:predicted nucleic acid-binding protein
MRLLDSNLIIYAAQDEYAWLRTLIVDEQSGVSLISKLEVLGYRHLTVEDKTYFESVFRIAKVYPIDNEIIEQAILLRQTKMMSTGDAIIAATAILKRLELYTSNTSDFVHIAGLTVIDPLAI